MNGFLSLCRGDIAFQRRYGFYFLYVLFTLVYDIIIASLPVSWQYKAAILCVFTDPAAMGLFFMGAIILFEKNQRVLDSIRVAPVGCSHYCAAKICSIGIVSLTVGVLIAAPFGAIRCVGSYIIGLCISSAFFTLLALCAASQCRSLNSFILCTVPIELMCIIPAVLYLFGLGVPVLRFHPCALMLDLLQNTDSAARSLSGAGICLRVLILCVWVAGAYVAALASIKKMFQSLGEFRL